MSSKEQIAFSLMKTWAGGGLIKALTERASKRGQSHFEVTSEFDFVSGNTGVLYTELFAASLN